MNDTELDSILETWEAPEPSPALRDGVRLGMPHKLHTRSRQWLAAAASIVVTTGLIGVATLGKGQAQLADGSRIQNTLMVEPAEAQARLRNLGHALSTQGNVQEGYYFNPATRTYSGYQLTVKPVNGNDYLMTVQRLDKALNAVVSAQAAQFRAVPLPAIPPARVVKSGEYFIIELARDNVTGQRILERVQVHRGNAIQNAVDDFTHTIHQRHMQFALWLHSLMNGEPAKPKLFVNGVAGATPESMSQGSGVHFYLPDSQVYVMTLGKRDGLEPAGTVNGSIARFHWAGKDYRIETAEPMSTDGEHSVYVLQYEDFRRLHAPPPPPDR
jgi:hypothetical protein